MRLEARLGGEVAELGELLAGIGHARGHESWTAS